MLLFIVLAVTAAILAYSYSLWRLKYWKVRGVKTLETSPFVGNFGELMFKGAPPGVAFKKFYDRSQGEPYIGLYALLKPAVMVRDPEIIKHVFTKDFSHFHDRAAQINETVNPLSQHLFSLAGARWRNLRIKLTPAFTSAKIKKMYPLMVDCSAELLDVLKETAQVEGVVDMKDILSRFNIDIIGSCAFGVKCNSLRDPDAEFRRIGMKFFQRTITSTLRQIIFGIFPKLGSWIPFRPQVTKFFMEAVNNTLALREKNNIKRDDFLDLLIELKKKGKIVVNPEESKEDGITLSGNGNDVNSIEFTDSLLASQAFVFFVAGFETSATTMSFCLLELSRNMEIQDKLYREIATTVAKHGSLTYEAIMDMPYLDMVVDETMRKYAPVPVLHRQCTEAYNMPNSNVKVEVGTRVFVPVYAMHNDPAIYPDPDRFDPYRFSPESKAARHAYSFLPFGEGPRNCLAARFGLVQVKVGLASLILRYEFRFDPKTVYPVQFQAGTFISRMKGENYLQLRCRP